MPSVVVEPNEEADEIEEETGLVSETREERPELALPEGKVESSEEIENTVTWKHFVMCVIGLQASYITWGVLQERVMTTEYEGDEGGEMFPSATFCVFSNRVMAIMLGAVLMRIDQGNWTFSAPLYMFAPAAFSNTLSSYGQYEALHYVSFPLQTLSKSTKVIPVMLMGKILNGRSYPWVEYGEAVVISVGVSIFALGGTSKDGSPETAWQGVAMLLMYVLCDSFTAQYQSRVFKSGTYNVSQFEMMLAINAWAILFTFAALLVSGEWWITLDFLGRHPSAIWENVGIAVTSATGQLCIFYTIKNFGPVVFTLIMTTRQIFSMVVSSILFVHPMGVAAVIGALMVFTTLFVRARRNMLRSSSPTPTQIPQVDRSK